MDKIYYVVVKSWYNKEGYFIENVFEWLTEDKERAIQYTNLLNAGNYFSKDSTKLKYTWFEKK